MNRYTLEVLLHPSGLVVLSTVLGLALTFFEVWLIGTRCPPPRRLAWVRWLVVSMALVGAGQEFARSVDWVNRACPDMNRAAMLAGAVTGVLYRLGVELGLVLAFALPGLVSRLVRPG